MNTANVAIVILNWNGEKLLNRFLPSVLAHSRQKGVDVIVADNGSDDNSLSLLRKCFPEVRLLKLYMNQGFARGYNQALKQVKTDYYILLNSDVEVSPNWITPLIRPMEEDPSVAAVQPKILSWHKKNEFEYAGAAGGFIDKQGFPFCRGRILNVTEKDQGQYDRLIPVFWASGACMAIRSRAFREAGGFDPDFWAHMEEIDLCWRMKNKGYRILCTPFSTVYHLGGGSLSYDNPKKLYLNFRNSLFMLVKNLPPGKLAKVLLPRMILDGAAALKFLTEGNLSGFGSVWKAHLAFYLTLPKLIKKRNVLIAASNPVWHPEILNHSLIWDFYIHGKKSYTEITEHEK
ncbi:MAG: glycosyltransferase family 2 protein [Mangrovibacterium sp.]